MESNARRFGNPGLLCADAHLHSLVAVKGLHHHIHRLYDKSNKSALTRSSASSWRSLKASTQKIGLLPSDDALGVSAIYNVVTGMRMLISSLSSDKVANADDEVPKAMLIRMADEIEKQCLDAQHLVERLKRISAQGLVPSQKWWKFGVV